MISWARAVLGQTQTIEAPVDLEGERLEFLTAKKIESLQATEQIGRSPGESFHWLPLVLSVAVAIGALILLGQEVQRSGRLGEELFSTQRQVAQLLVNNRELTQQMTDLQMQRNELDERVLALGAQLTAAMSEVESAKSHVIESQRLSKQFSETEAYFKTQLSTERAERETAQREATQLRQEKDDAEQSVEHLRQRLALLERDYGQLAGQVTAAKSTPRPEVNLVATIESSKAAMVDRVVTSQRETPSKVVRGQQPFELAPVVVPSSGDATHARVRAQLIEINGVQRFIIIDQGSADGVREGMAFDILHHGVTIGQAKAIRVRPHMAACDTSSTMLSRTVEMGDTVVQRAL